MGCHFSAELGRFGHQKMVPNWWTRRPCSWGHSPSGGQYGSGTRGHAFGRHADFGRTSRQKGWKGIQN